MASKDRASLALCTAGAVSLSIPAYLGSAQPAGSAPKSALHPSTACSQLSQLTSVFPRATAVGFVARQPISPVRHARGPIWPGRCGGFFTIYRRYRTGGAKIDISVTLYKTAPDLAGPLGEPLLGPVRTQRNGARVRTLGPVPTSVNGAAARETGVVSAYRRIFISSISISLAKTPVPVAAQLRVHRQIEAAFRALG